jgi:toxin secretion/phage lysis holin
MQLQAGILTVVFGSAITFSFGIWTESLTVLTVLMGIDYISGVVAALKSGTGLNSSIGYWGLAKKGLTLLVILLAHRLDVLLGTNMVMGGAVAFYIFNELLSVIENYGRIGLPLPDSVRRVVQILRDRAGGN